MLVLQESSAYKKEKRKKKNKSSGDIPGVDSVLYSPAHNPQTKEG